MKTFKTIPLIAAMTFSGSVLAEDCLSENMKTAGSNAWLEGKLETTYTFNTHLNPFEIDTEVKGEKAILKGSVESDIDRELAEEIAYSIDGIEDVENQLTVDASQQTSNDESDEGRSFTKAVTDATTTATIKTKLLANGEVSGLGINVDTFDGVVTLSGSVHSEQAEALAVQIAQNVDGVEKVESELKTSSSS